MIVQRFPFRSLEEAKDIPAFHFVSALSYKRLIECKCGLFFLFNFQDFFADVARRRCFAIIA